MQIIMPYSLYNFIYRAFIHPSIIVGCGDAEP